MLLMHKIWVKTDSDSRVCFTCTVTQIGNADVRVFDLFAGRRLENDRNGRRSYKEGIAPIGNWHN